jgi:hypothetical protein
VQAVELLQPSYVTLEEVPQVLSTRVPLTEPQEHACTCTCQHFILFHRLHPLSAVLPQRAYIFAAKCGIALPLPPAPCYHNANSPAQLAMFAMSDACVIPMDSWGALWVQSQVSCAVSSAADPQKFDAPIVLVAHKCQCVCVPDAWPPSRLVICSHTCLQR